MVKRSVDPKLALAVAYLRVSTDEQRLGLEAQRAAIEAWATAPPTWTASWTPIAIHSWHTDEGVSGTTPVPDRPGLLAAIAAVGASRASVLIVAKRDRLARDVFAGAMVEQLIARHGAVVVSAAGEGSETDPAGVLMRRMVDSFAEYEVALIRSRTKAALGALRARGQRSGTVPMGFVTDAVGKLHADAREARAITLAHGWRNAGLSQRRIVFWLSHFGYRARSGKPYGLKQVWRMLKRDV